MFIILHFICQKDNSAKLNLAESGGPHRDRPAPLEIFGRGTSLYIDSPIRLAKYRFLMGWETFVREIWNIAGVWGELPAFDFGSKGRF